MQRFEGRAGGDPQRRYVLYDKLDRCTYVLHFFFEKIMWMTFLLAFLRDAVCSQSGISVEKSCYLLVNFEHSAYRAFHLK